MTYSEQLLDAIQNHDFSDNRILLKKALDNDDPEILASLAENLTDLGFTDLSKEVYRFLIGQFPKEDLFKVYLAEILLNDGTLLLGAGVAVIAAACYFFIDKDEKLEKEHEDFLAKLRRKN